MALLTIRRGVAFILLLLAVSVGAVAQGMLPTGPRLEVTARVSAEGRNYADVYLLAADPKELLKAAGLRLNRDLSDGEDEGEALIAEFLRVADIARTGIFSGDSEYLREFNKKATWALMPHIVDNATTDEEGRRTLRAARTGSFYLMGGAQPPASAVWYMPIKLDRDQVSVRLDSSNTIAALRAKASQ